MSQLHKRLTDEQVRAFYQSYCQGALSRTEIQKVLEARIINAYRRISLFNHTIEVPNVPLREQVDIHLIPDPEREIMHIWIWHEQ